MTIQTADCQTLPQYAGVPQGSVLGIIPFLLYVNNISENLLSISRLFADDTSLACSATHIPDIESILNHDLIMISHWAKQWLVDFNPLFYNVTTCPPILVFDKTPIQFVEHHKNLGLTLSNNGKWYEHINNLTKSASKIL